jgi:hypothetical protein
VFTPSFWKLPGPLEILKSPEWRGPISVAACARGRSITQTSATDNHRLRKGADFAPVEALVPDLQPRSQGSGRAQVLDCIPNGLSRRRSVGSSRGCSCCASPETVQRGRCNRTSWSETNNATRLKTRRQAHRLSVRRGRSSPQGRRANDYFGAVSARKARTRPRVHNVHQGHLSR